MAADFHVGDVGTAIEFIVHDDTGAIMAIGTASGLQMSFQRSDGTKFTQTASLITDGTDGGMKYVTVPGDLNMPGNWQAQGILTFPSGLWHTDIQKFKVKPNISG